MDVDLIAKLVAPALSGLLLAVLKNYIEGRTKLLYFLVHSSAIAMRAPAATTVHSHSIVVVNAGKKAATDVRISHSFQHLPDFSIYPPVSYSVVQNPEGFSDIVIPSLVPKEQVSISYLYFPPLQYQQILGQVKCNEGLAKFIQTTSTPRPNRFIVAGLWTLSFIGAAFTLYWVIKLIWSLVV